MYKCYRALSGREEMTDTNYAAKFQCTIKAERSYIALKEKNFVH
jgi:hypothetical protein